MSLPFIADKTFKSSNYTVNHLPKVEYDNCSFVNCNFSDSYISGISFLECEFVDCNFSSVKCKEAMFKDVVFNNCKLLGVLFHDCNPFLLSMTFTDCILNFSSFFNLKIKNTRFKNCSLEQTDFTNSDLTECIFDNCSLYQTTFDNSILEKVDFRTATDLRINPDINRIKYAKFSKENALGLLAYYKIDIV